jgi:lipid II:glycine glycyltransferase (peptidoglycan interpeptide bridge formation enzyme)
MAPYLLHWEIMRYAKQQGYNWYDFYGITPATSPHHSWAGFTILKKKFGGEEFSSIGAYDFVYNKEIYQEYLKESDEV